MVVVKLVLDDLHLVEVRHGAQDDARVDLRRPFPVSRDAPPRHVLPCPRDVALLVGPLLDDVRAVVLERLDELVRHLRLAVAVVRLARLELPADGDLPFEEPDRLRHALGGHPVLTVDGGRQDRPLRAVVPQPAPADDVRCPLVQQPPRLGVDA